MDSSDFLNKKSLSIVQEIFNNLNNKQHKQKKHFINMNKSIKKIQNDLDSQFKRGTRSFCFISKPYPQAIENMQKHITEQVKCNNNCYDQCDILYDNECVYHIKKNGKKTRNVIINVVPIFGFIIENKDNNKRILKIANQFYFTWNHNKYNMQLNFVEKKQKADYNALKQMSNFNASQHVLNEQSLRTMVNIMQNVWTLINNKNIYIF